MKRKSLSIAIGILCVITAILGWYFADTEESPNSVSIADIPAFTDVPYIALNENQPNFLQDEIVKTAYEFYSELDAFNRCGYAMACIGKELMPNEDRGAIGQVKPSGWQTVKYDFVDGKYLYNRCHLIGFQLTGENANERNLITGTRFLNVEGMLPFENMVADYIKETGNHVMYRVTPVYNGTEIVARGVQIEALSVEDNGLGICFNIYAYNNQPGVIIDYTTGESRLVNSTVEETKGSVEQAVDYILNMSSQKFHLGTCTQGQNTKVENKQTYTGNRDQLIQSGYIPAGCCDP